MTKITIDYDKCEGSRCAECVQFCPMEVLIIEEDKIIVQNPDECSLCEICVNLCPNEAIKVEED
ncbi:MAG: 4Fe-4S binding protein [Methanobacterium sp.]|nr:4Fe-4S binding protein [Methanobacterium sp.]